MFHRCWIGCATHPLLQNAACISKFKQSLQLFSSAKQSLKPRKEQHNQQNNKSINTRWGCTKTSTASQTWARQVHKARLGETSGHKTCVATKALSALYLTGQSELSHHCFDDLWSWCNTHTPSVSGLSNSIINLLKAATVYLKKATAGFYTLIVKARFLITQYTLLSFWEKMGILGHTCYFILINTATTIIFHVTGLLRFCFSSQWHYKEQCVWPHTGMSQPHWIWKKQVSWKR